MSISLRDQLAGLGFKPIVSEKPAPRERPAPAKSGGKPHPGQERRSPAQQRLANPAPRTDAAARPKRRPPASEMDLGKAYALRAQKEKDERIAAEKAKQEAARQRREARAALAVFLRDKGLNDPAAELTRHFEYGGKIKRVHVTAEQLKALNAGELGVVQNDGRYLLVSAATLAEAETLFAEAIALKIDPNAPAADDPYADPRYQVPDDLVW